MSKPQVSKQWCVQHRTGWCATADGSRPPETVANAPTACGYVVVFPGGIEHRAPDCPECVAALTAPAP